MLDLPVWLPVVFFIVAVVYSMVGFAGGSSYLALLILAGFPYQQVPPIALVCNLVVSISACWHFYKGGFFNIRTVLPFVVFSIPMAFLGGKMTISKELFYILLGFSLLMAAVRMVLASRQFEEPRFVSQRKKWAIGLPMGASLGFLSGLVGIGGGIFLSPLLILMRWVSAKQAAAAASFFIMVNSSAGLLGHIQKTMPLPGKTLFFLALIVLAGGQLGASLGSYRLPRLTIQRVTAFLVSYVAIHLIIKVF